jgi:hypothetical protein
MGDGYRVGEDVAGTAAEGSVAMSDFYRRLDEAEQQNRLNRLFVNRPDNMHDYQGCANDPSMQLVPGKKEHPVSPQSASEPAIPVDLLSWVAQALDIVALYRAGYKPDYVADGLLDKYRSWPVEEKYKVQQYAPFLGQRSIVPKLLSFTDVHSRCAYWSSGNHIVTNGICRCGKAFRILEVQG